MRPTITYEHLNDKNQWVRVTTYHGKWTENADQAVARDLLANGMMTAYRRGVDIRIHVHDQAVGLAKEDEAEKKLHILVDSMKQNPKWGYDLPLDAAGSINRLFLKD